MATLLEANEVTKIYAKGQRPSLNKVSFNVAESEFIAIMGASGSGKTTLLNVLSTIDTPTSGSIVINGVNLKQLSDTGSADFRRGCLLIGIFYGLFERGHLFNADIRLFLTVGLCGGFTTFSTFMNENFVLLREQNYLYFISYTALSVILGLTAIYAGHLIAKAL